LAPVDYNAVSDRIYIDQDIKISLKRGPHDLKKKLAMFTGFIFLGSIALLTNMINQSNFLMNQLVPLIIGGIIPIIAVLFIYGLRSELVLLDKNEVVFSVAGIRKERIKSIIGSMIKSIK